MTDGPVVVVGGGQAASTLAVTLAERGLDRPVILVAEEAEVPYQRPPLSKAYLEDVAAARDLPLRPAEYYRDRGIDLRVGRRAVGVDRAAHRLQLDDGAEIDYGHLVLATGTRPRPLPVPGAELDGVLGLYTRADADDLRARLALARRLVCVGAGFVGLEVAAAGVAAGLEVTVVEATDRVMSRVATATVSEHFAWAHTERGCRVLLGAGVVGIEPIAGTDRVGAVRLADGTEIPADVVVVGIGALPRTELAEAAGLAVDGAIVVDEYLRTSDPDISAIGDCAALYTVHDGERVRRQIQSVQNATDQARCVAARLAGEQRPYTAVPWFWSDQYDFKLQVAGLVTEADQVVVKEFGPGRFSVLAFRRGRLLGAESVNRPADHMAVRRLLAAGVAPGPDEMADPDFDLKTAARAVG